MISSKGVDFLIRLEGERLSAYKDSGGALTIGVGHLLSQSERRSGKIVILGINVRYAGGITKAQSNEILMNDLLSHESIVRTITNISEFKKWEQHHCDAMICLSFNIGAHAFSRSTLARMVREGALESIPAQFLRWAYDNGKIIPGLLRRRKREAFLFDSGVYS